MTELLCGTRSGLLHHADRQRRRQADRGARQQEDNHVTVDAEIDEDTSGALYALGGVSGGLTLYMEMGELVCEYNMMIVERYTARSTIRLAPAQTPALVGRVAGRGGSDRGRQGGRSRPRQAHCASRLYRQREP